MDHPKKSKPRFERGMVALSAGLVAITVLAGIKLFQEGDRVAISDAYDGYAPVTRSFGFIMLVVVSVLVIWSTYKDWKHDREVSERRTRRWQ